MLSWAIMFAAAAGIAGLLGFGGVCLRGGVVARGLFFVFLVALLVMLVAAILSWA